MTVLKRFELARVFSPTTGTGSPIALTGGAVPGYRTFADAGAVDGNLVAYSIRDGVNSEVGSGIIGGGVTTLTRNIIASTNFNNPINLTGLAEVFIGPRAADFGTGANQALLLDDAGIAIFAAIPILPASDPTTSNQATRKAYVDQRIKAVIHRIITTSQSWVPTAGMLFAKLECVGSGGGGGNAVAATGQVHGGGGGGGGAYSRSWVTAAQVGASQPVTIGPPVGNNLAGNATSIGSLCSAEGGGGGGTGSTAQMGAGGQGGQAASGIGDFRSSGSPGGNGTFISTASAVQASTGFGGGSIFGGGAPSPAITGSINNGINGTNYGGGGSGGVSNATTSASIGGSSGQGVAIITEFIGG